ncbi:MAG: cellulase family glycosylhydrolase, partial [bacterium]
SDKDGRALWRHFKNANSWFYMIVKVVKVYDVLNEFVPYMGQLFFYRNHYLYEVNVQDGILSVGYAEIPPDAALSASTALPLVGESLAFDASGSSDDIDALSVLSFRFDFEGDGVWDTTWAQGDATETTAYATAGPVTCIVEVKDLQDLSAQAHYYLNVQEAGSGTIEINVNPDSGQWRLLGPANFSPISESGDLILTEVPTGGYTLICYDTLPNYNPPTAQTSLLANGETITFTANWTDEGGTIPPPTVADFLLNDGASSTSSRNVTLNNTCTGSPTHYMASESSDFAEALWEAYSPAPSITLSSGNGTKSVYFKVKNLAGESDIASDNIQLSEVIGSANFVRAKGSVLVTGEGENERPVYLRGVSFGNRSFDMENDLDPIGTARKDPAEEDFQRVREMGMNTVRFYLSFYMFENSQGDAAWEWLDENVEWARANDVYLILNIHVPPGGFQQDGDGDGVPDGLALWRNEDGQQDQLKTLWRDITSRYKNEPTIAGYDLLNEPTTTRPPTGEPKYSLWKDLAEELIAEIREEDTNHLIVVESLAGAYDDESVEDPFVGWIGTENLPDDKQFLVSDPNVMYDFHFYYPWDYTLQCQPWSDPSFPCPGVYPDESVTILPWDLQWVRNIEGKPITPGTSDWDLHVGNLSVGIEEGLIAALPAFASYENLGGSVYYDGLKIDEYASDGTYLDTVLAIDVSSDEGWERMLDPPSQPGAGFDFSSSAGHDDNGSLSISNPSAYAQWSNPDLRFLLTQGHRYKVTCWMKGQNVTEASFSRATIGLYRSEHGIPVFTRNQVYLMDRLSRFLVFATQNEVPVNLGEFGLVRQCFEPGSGGIQYVTDVLDFLIDHGVNFTYHSFREDTFGLYPYPPHPDSDNTNLQPNQDLINLLQERLTGAQPSSIGTQTYISMSIPFVERSPRKLRIAPNLAVVAAVVPNDEVRGE